jgi:hypothetical protein
MSLGRITTALLALALGVAAGTTGAVFWNPGGPRTSPSIAGHRPSPAQRPGSPSDEEACLARRQAVLSLPALPGVPALEARRAELVARAKGESVLFLETPTAGKASSPLVEKLRQSLFGAKVAWQGLNAVTRGKRTPQELREILLTDGYLYAETPELASLLASGIVLSQLFTEPELELVRGSRTHRLLRRKTDYVFAEGPEEGQLARLWLFDRVSVHGETLGPARHVSFTDLRERLGATSIAIERLTAEAVAARLRYAELEIPAVLAIKEGRLELECEAVPAAQNNQIAVVRSEARRRSAVLTYLRRAIDEQVEEGLPFDEPKTEEGQQDGKLRQEWRQAYRNGRAQFEFNGDQYPVFDSRGRPRSPQVCVDFITDTLERMSGTHFGGRAEPRERTVGKLDFDTIDIENRRSVEQLIAFAEAHPDWFEVLAIPESERIIFGNRSAFFQRLYDRRADFRPGDIVAILGPRDDERLHYHSFFIVADDPVTGMPTWLASNAGRPRIRTWEGEMQNAPRRAIMARIRPRTEWLESLVPGQAAPKGAT